MKAFILSNYMVIISGSPNKAEITKELQKFLEENRGEDFWRAEPENKME